MSTTEADLKSATVLRTSDVTAERERSRRRRTVTLLLSVIAVVVAVDGLLVLLSAHVLHLPGIHVPRYDMELIPGGLLGRLRPTAMQGQQPAAPNLEACS
jgi:hypothetical protein